MAKMVCLNGLNYQKWRVKMKDLLFVKKMHLLVFATEKPDGVSDVDWDFEHQQVCGFIRQWIEDNGLNHIINDTHARTLWEKLEKLYASKTGNNKLFLLKQIMNLRYKEGCPISNHENDFQGILNQLNGMGIKFEDEVQGLWLLNTLPDAWETFRVSWTNAAPNGVVATEYAKSGSLNEEIRRMSQGSISSTSHSEILVTEDRGRSRYKSHRGKDESKSKSRPRYKDLDCHHCGKKGPIKKYCFQLKKEKRRERKNCENKNRVSTTTTGDDLLFTYDENVINFACHETS